MNNKENVLPVVNESGEIVGIKIPFIGKMISFTEMPKEKNNEFIWEAAMDYAGLRGCVLPEDWELLYCAKFRGEINEIAKRAGFEAFFEGPFWTNKDTSRGTAHFVNLYNDIAGIGIKNENRFKVMTFKEIQK